MQTKANRNTRALVAALAVFACLALPARAPAELPLARLTAIFPPGGQAGTTIEVTLTGQDLDDVNRLYFAIPGISAKPKISAGKVEPGNFLVTIDAGVPPGLYDLRAVGRFGISNPRTLLVSDRPELVAKPGNTSAMTAVELPVGIAIDAVAEANAEQFFRLALMRDQRVCVEASTTRLDSKMEAVLVLDDPSGRELARSRPGMPLVFEATTDGDYLVRIHDVLYRGGAEFFFHLSATAGNDTSTAPMAGSLRWPFPPAAAFLDPDSLLADIPTTQSLESRGEAHGIDPPCEVIGQFQAGRPREAYTFDAPAGGVYWVEITSHRLGQTLSAPLLVVQRITKDAQGNEQAADVQEVYDTPAGGTPEFPTTTRDPSCRLEVKDAGTYRLLVRNLLQSAAEDRPVPYRLAVRRESPDFRLVAIPTSPLPEPKDSKDVPLWSTLLRRGGTTPITVVAGRRDGFAGAIRLEVEGLPPGVTAGPAIISAGASTGWVLLTADDDAVGWAGAVRIYGAATIGDKQVTREALPGVISLSTYDTNTKLVVVRSRLADEFAMAVSETESAPLTVALATASGNALEVPAGGKLSIPLRLARSADFTTPIAFKLAGHPLLAGMKEVTADPKADSVSLELDLAQIKLPPGQYTFYVQAQGKLKYQSKDVTASFYSPSFAVSVTAPTVKKDAK
jgi:hypothetical protein